MIVKAKVSTSASSDRFQNWDSVSWSQVEKTVKRLQMRIAKATREGRYGKVKSLQWILTHSYHAKLLAVKRVTQSSGAKTPGIDNVTWKSSASKFEAVKQIKRKNYKPKPLRRVYIPKAGGKKRPLGIPTMMDRCQQALYLLGLEPVSETLADSNAYGFRPQRSCQDAIQHCFNLFSKKTSAQWVLEGDIKSCFDEISHDWLLSNIPVDTKTLKGWLEAGYMEQNNLHETVRGTPQGGIISPTLLVLTLAGLQKKVTQEFRITDRVKIVSYADDFIISGVSKEILEERVKPIVEKFLKDRGLFLSKEKTKITNIFDGFDFLGFNIRKYRSQRVDKLLIKPSKASRLRFLSKIREVVKKHKAISAEELIGMLNPKIRGWSNYYRHVVSKKTFNRVDNELFRIIWPWCKRRHQNKNNLWIKKKYFRIHKQRDWVFFSNRTRYFKGLKYLDLYISCSTKIQRYVKVKATANPYDPDFTEYYRLRKQDQIRKKRFKVDAPLPTF